METQKQIHCIASISYSASGTHQQHWIQHWNEVDASGTSYRYNDNCNRSAPTKSTTGKHESPINGVQDRADVIKIYYKTWENHPRRKTQQPRYVMARHQASQIRKCAATQRYSDNQRTQVICCQLQYYRPYWRGSLVRHHENYSKRKVESQFWYHRKRKYDTIFYWYSMDCGRGEAYNGQMLSED